MKWSIPAKTFLLGEYVAIAGGPAIVLTTTPCFELTLSDKPGLHGIHPESPAGRWWGEHGDEKKGLSWDDPYQGRGGMGASSAQFLGVYLASMHLQKKTANQDEMLAAYLQSSWQGEGLRPSGYDVLAQSLSGCVYINRQKSISKTYAWPFKGLAFLLLHTGQKLATHQHLQTMALPGQIDQLAAIVEQANSAFEQANSHLIIEMVNAYHQQLEQMNLVANHSLQHIAFFKEEPDVLAVKGCGAMGADVLLLLVPIERQEIMKQNLTDKGWNIIATTTNLLM